MLRRELVTVLCQSVRFVEWQGSALRQSLLSIFFHEQDDRIAKKLLFLMFVGLQACLWTGLVQNAWNAWKSCAWNSGRMCARNWTLSGIMQCVYMGQGMAGWQPIMWKNMLDSLCNVNSESAKLEQRYSYLIILILSLPPTAARTLDNTSWPLSLASLESGPQSLL